MSEPKPPTADDSPALIRGWIAIFAVTFLLYALTANRSAQWQDSGYHILRVVTGEVVNPLGFALSHPLHHWLGRLFVVALPLEPAFAVTLVSALAGAIAVANVYGCALYLVGHRGVALWAALSLAVANVFWQLATIAETYSLAAALLSAECWCLVVFVKTRRRTPLAGLLFFNGLGIANHMLAILTIPTICVLLVIAIKNCWTTWRTVAIAAGCWLVGASPYLYLIVARVVHTGDLWNTIHSALFGNAYARNVLNVTPTLNSLASSTAFLALSFPSLLLPAAAYGIWRGKAPSVPKLICLALLGSLVLHLLFAVRYDVVDQHIFFMPSYVLLAIFGSIGAAAYLTHGRRRAGKTLGVVLLATTPVFSALAPIVASSSASLGGMVHRKPYRDDFVYLLTPWSVVKDSAERMGSQAIELAGSNGLVIVEDSMARFALRYFAIVKSRDGVEITTETDPLPIQEALDAGRPVVLVPLDRDKPTTRTPVGTWQRVGDLYQLQPTGPG